MFLLKLGQHINLSFLLFRDLITQIGVQPQTVYKRWMGFGPHHLLLCGLLKLKSQW